MVYNLGILIVLMLSGLVVGWRVRDGVVNFFAIALALLFTYTPCHGWVSSSGGWCPPSKSRSRSPSRRSSPSFLSSVFVPIETLPGWLQPIAEWNPVTTPTASMRDLFGNPNPYPGDGFLAEHPILVTVLRSIVFVVVFAPLAVRRYRDTSR